MSGIIGWIAGKIKWALLLAAIGGPVIAYFSWQDGERIRRIAAQGVETQASVEGATRSRSKRGVTSYAIDLAWKDAAGQDRKAEKISVSRQFADRIIANDRLTVGSLRIKYLPDEPGKSGVVLVEDAAKQAETDSEMIYVGAGAGLIGIVGSGLFFLGGRRRERSEIRQAA
jgi:hypothetical protein